MSDISLLKYVISEFDEKNKTVKVTFGDGAWAQIRLSTPLPTNIQELENQIKMYAPPVEHLQAQSQEIDLSFITSNIGVERTCERHQLSKPQNSTNEEDYLSNDELLNIQITVAIQKTLAEMAGATV